MGPVVFAPVNVGVDSFGGGGVPDGIGIAGGGVELEKVVRILLG